MNEEKTDYAKAYREANKEKIKAYHRAWTLANPHKNKEYKKAWREANKEHISEYHKNYYNMKNTVDLTNTRAKEIYSGKRVRQPNTYGVAIKCNVIGFTDQDAKDIVAKIQKAVGQYSTNISIELSETNCITLNKRIVKI
jgi:hypothetical protein